MRTKSLFWSLILALVFASACELDEDDNPDPADDRDKFIGAWNVNETCNRDSYSVQIDPDPTNSSQVIIRNFWLIGYQASPPYGIVAGNTITLPNQPVGDNISIEVEGSGKYENGDIEWSYTVNDGADLWSCNATYSR